MPHLHPSTNLFLCRHTLSLLAFLFYHFFLLSEVMRDTKRELRNGERSMDREVRDLERQEKKLEIDIKALAKKGDRKSATILVRQLQHCTLHIAIYIS